jgi:hypothetical protein
MTCEHCEAMAKELAEMREVFDRTNRVSAQLARQLSRALHSNAQLALQVDELMQLRRTEPDK